MITREFYLLIRDIVRTEEFQSMKHCRHHVKGSVYDHSVKVAYFCYCLHRRLSLRTDLGEFVRGALLHDFYLYDWHDRQHRFHGFTHPRHALSNAEEHYPDLTRRERDMILRHMFPLTLIPPKTAAGWMVCGVDKVAAVSDYLGKNKWKLRHMHAFTPLPGADA